MGVFDRVFGKGRLARAAERAELGGDLTRASELWADAGRPDEAARVLVLRSDAELDPRARLLLLGRALDLASTLPGPVADDARRKRAHIYVELAKSGALAAGLRHELRAAAEDLESLGDAHGAAEAFQLLGDEEGRARALVLAGDVDELEYALHTNVVQERASRELRLGASRVDELVQSGERRAALTELEGLARTHPSDAAVRERIEQLLASRLLAPALRVSVHGVTDRVLLGDVVRIGRTEGEIVLGHAAISRTHLRLFRDAAGVPHALDLDSRNGTLLRGVRLAGPLPLPADATTELALGGEVPLRLTTTPRGLRIELAGERYLAALGPTKLGVDDWSLTSDADGWIVLERSSPAFFGAIALGKRTELLAGDTIAAERSGATVVRVER